MSNLSNKSRYMSKLLRHSPEDLKLDSSGYVLVDDLLIKLEITIDDLVEIVDTNDKKRFAFNADQTKIRASQGHSKGLDVTVSMKVAERVDYLFHGTASKNMDSIMKSGLISGNRKHVHLTNNKETAKRVAFRHSKDIILFKVDSARMRADNIKIYISDNNVYLTDKVDSKYLEII